MSEELQEDDGKKPWVWKAAIVALPVGLALSAGIGMVMKVNQGEKTGMEAVTYQASEFDVAGLKDAVSKIENQVGSRSFVTEDGQRSMQRMTAFVSGSLSSINLGYQVFSDDGEAREGRLWKNYWIDSNNDVGDGDLLIWTTYSDEKDSASVAALLSVAEWMRGREFEHRIRVAFLRDEAALPELEAALNQKKSQITMAVSGLGQGTRGLLKTGGGTVGPPPSEAYRFTGKEGEETASDWTLTFAWDEFEQQVRDLCEEISDLAGERVVFKK